MKQSRLRRSSPGKIRAWKARSKPLRRKKKYQPSRKAVIGAQIRNMEAFKLAARDQMVCAVCGRVDSWDAHHVIARRHLAREGLPLYVASNALRVCDRFSKNRCHVKHEDGSRRIRLKELTDESIEYAITILGPGAGESYLRRHYTGSDPRLERALEELNGA